MRGKLTVMLVLLLAVVAFAMSPVAASEESVEGKAQTHCPVMGGEINEDIYVDYEGKRIYFCCAACPDTFMKNPDKYLEKMEAEGVVLEDAPESE